MGIHGDKSQQERDWVLNGEIYHGICGERIFFETIVWLLYYWITIPLPSEFRYGKAPILIATDVASRGLGQYITK